MGKKQTVNKMLPNGAKLEGRSSSHTSDSSSVARPPADGTIERMIGEAENILVICHVDPDGDAIGSLLGLGWALHKMGKRHTLVCADTVPDQFRYLPGWEKITSTPPQDPDLVIALDCSDLKRMGDVYDPRQLPGVPLINIDHHVTNDKFGTVNWIDPQATATSEMVLGLIERLGVSLDRTIAVCLLNGIVTDTLGFRTPNTTPHVMEAAVQLMNAGASLSEVTDRAFNRRPLALIRLWAEAVANLQMKGRIIWSEVTRFMRQAHQIPENFGGGIASFLSSANEADAAIVFTEKDDGSVDVSMRSVPGVDVSRAAVRLGGGGHPQAAGCTLDGDLDSARAKVLAEVERVLAERGQQRDRPPTQDGGD